MLEACSILLTAAVFIPAVRMILLIAREAFRG